MHYFKHIGIIGFVDKVLIKGTVTRLINFLQTQDVSVCLEEGPEVIEGVPGCSREQMGQNCDLVIVVGGDGSLLHAGRDLVDSGVPILGINRGRLGFLTDILPHELEQRVSEILQGKFSSSERFLLEATMIRDGKVVDQSTALNDIVLQSDASIRMVEFELIVDSQFVYNQRADGLIVSTPTGSTAYALSGGGSIVHPTLQAINLVPVNPHTLSNRPILVNSESELEIYIVSNNAVEARVVCDGQIYLDTQLGDRVQIRKKDKQLRLLHPAGHDFYATCRTKLNWAKES